VPKIVDTRTLLKSRACAPGKPFMSKGFWPRLMAAVKFVSQNVCCSMRRPLALTKTRDQLAGGLGGSL